MDLIKLVIVFAVVIGLVANKKSMSTAVIIGSIACWILYKIPANVGAITVANTVTSLTVLKMIGVMYVITFMQRMMEKKNAINTARDGLSGLFNSRWVNCAAAPIFLRLMPLSSPAIWLKLQLPNIFQRKKWLLQHLTSAMFQRHSCLHTRILFLPWPSQVILQASLLSV